MEEEENRLIPEHLPIYQKGREIFEITSKIADLIPDDDDYMQSQKQWMLEDASLLTVKVTGAEAADIYDIRMENAAIIRKAARELTTHCAGLEASGFKETEYLNLIREHVEEYRLLFVEWIKGFDPWNYIIDRWGLFNPPGVNFDDHDPDDDIPFDPDQFFDE